MNRLMICALLLSGLCGCERREAAPQVSQQNDLPDQEIWNFTVTATEKGNLQAVIQAGHMRRFSNRSLALFDQGVHIDFYDEHGRPASVLTALGGESDDNSGNVKIIGNVAVVSDSGFTLHTEELLYHKAENRIFSNVKVMVTTEQGDTLRGVGFESDTQMNDWRILNPYEGVAHKGADLRVENRRKTAPKKPEGAVTDAASPDSTATE